MPPPSADLVLIFRGSSRTKQEATDAEQEYSNLVKALRAGGLKATGKRGTKDGEILIFVHAPDELLNRLVQAERYRDFINNVPSYSLPSVARTDPLVPAERIRFTHGYVTAPKVDDGLGICIGAAEWNRLESIMCLQDEAFNHKWLTAWSTKKLGLGFSLNDLEDVKNQFGEHVAMYFAFVSYYARALVFPSALGAVFFYFSTPFHPLYSILLSIWSIIFVETWRLKEQRISVKWGSFGIDRVELRRAQFVGANDATDAHDDTAFPWWKREIRVGASLPVVAIFATALTVLLTSIFVVEAFVTQLYTGPGVKYVSLTPTALFMLLVPRLVGYYQTYAVKLTGWENHVYQSAHEKSLALKTFALSSIVAYGGLYLSAFVYVPFGEQIMALVQTTFFTSPTAKSSSPTDQKIAAVKDARKVLNPDRLKNQVFAYLITNQVIGEFLEIGVPTILKYLGIAKTKAKETKMAKKVGWEDEKSPNMDLTSSATTEEDRMWLEDVRQQVQLPDYDVFGDYSEMITQFGYCVLWSACWSLAPIGALVNNYVELRGDAYKIAQVTRRPLPRRADSIGPWLDILSFLTWQGALINSALVFLFYRGTTDPYKEDPKAFINEPLSESFLHTIQRALIPALLIALSTSHAFFLVRASVRHVAKRALWSMSEEELRLTRSEREVKRSWLKDVVGQGSAASATTTPQVVSSGPKLGGSAFWEDDEGLAEVRRGSKAL